MRQPIQKNRSSTNTLTLSLILGTILLALPHSLLAQATSPWNTIHHNFQLDQLGPSGTTVGTDGWKYADGIRFITSCSVGFAEPPAQGDLFIVNGVPAETSGFKLRWIDPVSGTDIPEPQYIPTLGDRAYTSQPLVTNFTDDGINII